MRPKRQKKASNAVMDALGRAVRTVQTPPGRDPVARAVRRLKQRAHSATEKVQSLQHEIAAHAARQSPGTAPYEFDAKALTVIRRSTGISYVLHTAAYQLLEALYLRWQRAQPPIRAVQLTHDGTRGIHDAFCRPKTGDGSLALRDLVIRTRGRLSLRVP